METFSDLGTPDEALLTKWTRIREIRDQVNKDIETLRALEDALLEYAGSVLVISHDLDLLDEAITRVLHLDRVAEDATGHIVEYRGTYSQYQRARAEDEERLAKKAALQAKEIDHFLGLLSCMNFGAARAAGGVVPPGVAGSVQGLTVKV